MAAKYTAEQKADAKAAGLALATIDVAGLSFSDTVSEDEKRELVRFYLDFTARRADRLKADATANGGA
jgi:hypothetical protein